MVVIVGDCFSSDGPVEPAGVFDCIKRIGDELVRAAEDVGAVPGHIINSDDFPRIRVADFEARSPHPDTPIGADLFIDLHSEKIVDVLGGRDLFQRLPPVNEFAVEGRHIKRGVDGLMILVNPGGEIGIEFLEGGFRPSRKKTVS